MQVDEAQRHSEDMQEQCAVIERRSNLLTAEIEELRSALEQAERGRKLAETELIESRQAIVITVKTTFCKQLLYYNYAKKTFSIVKLLILIVSATNSQKITVKWYV